MTGCSFPSDYIIVPILAIHKTLLATTEPALPLCSIDLDQVDSENHFPYVLPWPKLQRIAACHHDQLLPTIRPIPPRPIIQPVLQQAPFNRVSQMSLPMAALLRTHQAGIAAPTICLQSRWTYMMEQRRRLRIRSLSPILPGGRGQRSLPSLQNIRTP
jgi:hypothetical protein